MLNRHCQHQFSGAFHRHNNYSRTRCLNTVEKNYHWLWLHWRTLRRHHNRTVTSIHLLEDKASMTNLHQLCRISRMTHFGHLMLYLWCQTGIDLPPSSLPHQHRTQLGLHAKGDLNWLGQLLKSLQTNLMLPTIAGHVCLGRDKKYTFLSSRKPTHGIH